MASFSGIGCTSGPSLDGLDLCYVEFTGDVQTDIWGYRIIKAITVPYTPEWQGLLKKAAQTSGEGLVKLHVQYGHFVGQTIAEFIQTEGINNLDFIASNGHSVFHQPDLGYTFNLGDGETTAVHLKYPFVCNFRNKDVALGGQGAPLVTNGEKFLFSYKDICLNLSGIANIGLRGLQGYDVCPCNYVSNKLANMHDPKLEYDPCGVIAKSGNILPDVLEKLESLDYYKLPPPKSVGSEWMEEKVLPLLDVSCDVSNNFLLFFFNVNLLHNFPTWLYFKDTRTFVIVILLLILLDETQHCKNARITYKRFITVILRICYIIPGTNKL